MSFVKPEFQNLVFSGPFTIENVTQLILLIEEPQDGSTYLDWVNGVVDEYLSAESIKTHSGILLRADNDCTRLYRRSQLSPEETLSVIPINNFLNKHICVFDLVEVPIC